MIGRIAFLAALLSFVLTIGGCGDTSGEEGKSAGGPFGRVIGIDGKPISGVTVGMLLRTTTQRHIPDEPTPGMPTTRSDSTGAWRLPPHADIGWVTATAEGYCRSTLRVHPVGVRYDVPMLRTAGHLHGEILDGGGSPVDGATVTTWVRTSNHEWHTTTTSGIDGSFKLSLPDRAPSSGSLHVSRAGYRGFHTAVPPLDASGTARVSLRLHGDPPVVGRVVDAKTGLPVAGAGVRWTGRVDDITQTDKEGRFELSDRSDHQWQVRVAANGYRLAFADPVPTVGGRSSVLVRLALGERPFPRMKLKESSVAGVVVDSAGSPIAGARVIANQAVGWTPVFTADATVLADEAGNFKITTSRAGPYVLRAHRLGACVTGTALIDLDTDDPTVGVRIVVPQGVELRGRYMGRRDEPLPDVIVVATCRESPGASWTTTDADGWFVLRGLPEADVFLKLKDLRVHVGHKVPGGAGKLDSPLRIDLQPVLPDRPPQGRKLRFVGVVPPDGTRLHAVGNLSDGGKTAETLYLFGGQSQLHRRKSGRWTFTGPGYYAGPLDIPVDGDAPAEVDVAGGHKLGGVITKTDGEPIAGASVSLPHKVAWDRSQEHDRHVHTDGRGRFEFSGVEPGEALELKIHATGFVGTSVETKRENSGLKIVLLREGCAAGRVVPREGETLPPHWRVLASLGDGPARAWMQSNQRDGRFECRHMLPGEWTLRVVTRDGAEGPPTTINLKEGSSLPDLRVTAPALGHSVSGRLLDDEGRRVSGATLLLSRLGETDVLRRTHTPADGSFEFRDLAAGRYDLKVDSRRGSPFGGATRAHVEAGAVPIDIVLPKRGRVLGELVAEPERGLGSCAIHLIPAGEAPTWQELKKGGGLTDGFHRGGRFVLDHVDPGTYEIFVIEIEDTRGYGLGVGRSSSSIVVEPGATVRDIRVSVRRSAALSVTVVDEGGSKATAGEVRVTHATWGALVRQVRENTPGYIAFRFLPPGIWRVQTRRSDRASWGEVTEVTLDPGQRAELEQSMPPH